VALAAGGDSSATPSPSNMPMTKADRMIQADFNAQSFGKLFASLAKPLGLT
jgi:hypothetical protein